MVRRSQLPPKFSHAERDAYQWLWDCGIEGWFVNLATKHVYTETAEFGSLVEYRDHLQAAAAAAGEE